MLERERHHVILKLVEERSFVGVAELLELLDASEATIRRDINTLAERGELKRIRGGAEALRPRSAVTPGRYALLRSIGTLPCPETRHRARGRRT